jgi:MFS family permease
VTAVGELRLGHRRAPGRHRRPGKVASLGVPAVFWRLTAAMTVSRLGLLVIPFLAYYLARGRHLDAGNVALVMMAFGAGWTAGQPCGGFLADRAGRRTVIIGGNLAAAAAYASLGLARTVPMMAAGALAVGATFDVWRPAAMAILAESAGTDDRQRQGAMSMLYLAMNAPEVAGILLAGALAVTAGWPWLFAGNAIACLSFACLALALVPPSRPVRRQARRHTRAAMTDPLLLCFSALTLLCLTVYQQSAYALPVRFAGTGIAPLSYALIAAMNPLTVTIVARPAGRWMDRIPAGKFPPARYFAVGIALIGVGIPLTGLGSGLRWYAATSVVWILGEVAIMGSGPALVTGLAPRGREASYSGVWMSTFGLSAVTAAGIGAALIGHGGLPLLWASCAISGLAAAAACLLLTKPVARRSTGQLTADTAEPETAPAGPAVAHEGLPAEAAASQTAVPAVPLDPTPARRPRGRPSGCHDYNRAGFSARWKEVRHD